MPNNNPFAPFAGPSPLPMETTKRKVYVDMGAAVQIPLALDVTPLKLSRMGRGLSIKERFLKFHEENPQVYANLVEMAKEAKKNGLRKIGFRQMWESLRWNIGMTTGKDYKLNNNYVPHYARLLMDTVPELAGMFETRSIRRA